MKRGGEIWQSWQRMVARRRFRLGSNRANFGLLCTRLIGLRRRCVGNVAEGELGLVFCLLSRADSRFCLPNCAQKLLSSLVCYEELLVHGRI